MGINTGECTWTVSFGECCQESTDDKLKRLESEQRRIADEIAELRKPPPKPKTRGEKVVTEFVRFTALAFSSAEIKHLADEVDAEIAKAKAGQKTADVEFVKSCGGYSTATWFADKLEAHSD